MKAAVDKKVGSITYREGKRSVFVNLLIIALVAVLSGFAVGMILSSMMAGDDRYNFDSSGLYDNVVLIREEAEGKAPNEISATKACILAFDTTFNCSDVCVKGTGSVVSMGVTQKIKALTIRKGSQIFKENVSVSSIVKAADRFYQDGDNVKRVKGNVSGSTVSWNGSNSAMTSEEFKEMMGGYINEYMGYIVSSKTVKSESQVTKNNEGYYEFTLILDYVKSVVNYVKSMKETGGLGDYPMFTQDIEIKLVIDSNYRIISFTSNEKYKVKKGVWVEAKGTLTNTFTYDGDYSIPPVSENSSI